MGILDQHSLGYRNNLVMKTKKKTFEDLALKETVVQPEPSKAKDEKPSKAKDEKPSKAKEESGSDSDAESTKDSTEIPSDSKNPVLPPIPSRTPPPPPPIFKDPGEPRRNTNQLIYIKQEVMPALWLHKFGWPFKKPVDAVKMKLPDYHIVIQKPMDFGTIRKRLVNKYYWESSECIEDINQVFRNSLIYNKPGQDITIMTQKVAKFFESKIAVMNEKMETEQEMDESFSSEKRKKRAPREAPVRKKPCFDEEEEIEEKPIAKKSLPDKKGPESTRKDPPEGFSRAALEKKDLELVVPVAKKSSPDKPGSPKIIYHSEDETEEESDSEESVVSDTEWMF